MASFTPDDSSERSITSLVVKDAMAVGEFKTPLVKKKKKERQVLVEDEYLERLEDIIARDYYPDLPKLKAQSEYLEALSRNDVAKIRQMQLKFSSRRTTPRVNSPTLRDKPDGSPDTFETPDVDDPAARKRRRPDTEDSEISTSINPECPAGSSTEIEIRKSKVDGMSINKFLNKYNSEDNAAFDDLQRLDDRRHKIKYGWMYKAEIEHNKKKISQGVRAIEPRPADEQLAIGYDRPKELDNWSYVARNSVLFQPEEADVTDIEANNLRKLNAPEIIRKNTRFEAPPFKDTEQAKQESFTKANIIQAVHNQGKIDAMGKEDSRLAGMQYPTLVTPSPAPGVDESPMMTWGEIEGTPFLLDASDRSVSNTPGPSFKMPDVPLRDQLAQDMTEQIKRRYRAKKERALQETKSYLKTTPRFGSVRRSTERLSSMSPAARRLATSKLGIRVGTDKQLKASYTPSPVRTPGTGKLIGKKTPGTSSSFLTTTGGKKMGPRTTGRRFTGSPSTGGSSSSAAKSSITDGLLDLGNALSSSSSSAAASSSKNRYNTKKTSFHSASAAGRARASDFF